MDDFMGGSRFDGTKLPLKLEGRVAVQRVGLTQSPALEVQTRKLSLCSQP
jgi:hypothetical protein